MTAEDAPPNAILIWPSPPKVVLFDYQPGNPQKPARPQLVGESSIGRSCRAKKVSQHQGVAGVRFELEGQLDRRIVAVELGQACELG